MAGIVSQLLDRIQSANYALGSSNARCAVLEAEVKRLQTVQSQTPATPIMHSPELVRELLVALRHGKIEAIKQVRTMTGLGLKEAKDLIESVYADTHWVQS